MDDSDVTTRDCHTTQDAQKSLKDKRNLHVKLQLDALGVQQGHGEGHSSYNRPPTPTPEKKHVISHLTTAELYKLYDLYPQRDVMSSLTRQWLNLQAPADDHRRAYDVLNLQEPGDDRRAHDVLSASDMSDVSVDSGDCVNHI